MLSGICGSDLATLDGRSSRYFEDLVSFPFVPGHEVVGTLEADGTGAPTAPRSPPGTRVVLQPVLGCAARGIEPPCPACAAGHTGDCEHVAFGHLRPGLQTGFCADTGGGWSTAGLVAHESQLHAVPDELSDEDAVTVEPVACAVHAVLGAGLRDGRRGGRARRRHARPGRDRRAHPPGRHRAHRPAPARAGRRPLRPPAPAGRPSSAPPPPCPPTSWPGRSGASSRSLAIGARRRAGG